MRANAASASANGSPVEIPRRRRRRPPPDEETGADRGERRQRPPPPGYRRAHAEQRARRASARAARCRPAARSARTASGATTPLAGRRRPPARARRRGGSAAGRCPTATSLYVAIRSTTLESAPSRTDGGSSACTGASESRPVGKFTVEPSGARTRTVSRTTSPTVTVSRSTTAPACTVIVDDAGTEGAVCAAAGTAPSASSAAARHDARARSPPSCARLARAEEADQRLDDAAVGVHRDLVDRQAAQQPCAGSSRSSSTAAANCARTSGSLVSTSSVAPVSGSTNRASPMSGSVSLARILDRDGDDVVPLRQQLERPLELLRLEVGDDEDDRLVREHLARGTRAPPAMSVPRARPARTRAGRA